MEMPDLPDSFWQMLADHNPVGMLLSVRDVQDWFFLKWPSYSQRSYKSHKQAIGNWWTRASEEEITKAIAAGDRRRDADETRALQAAVTLRLVKE